MWVRYAQLSDVSVCVCVWLCHIMYIICGLFIIHSQVVNLFWHVVDSTYLINLLCIVKKKHLGETDKKVIIWLMYVLFFFF